MGPAVFLLAAVALCLLALEATMRRTGRASRTRTPPFRRAVPWIAGGTFAMGGVLVVVPGVPPIVIGGLVAYTGVAVTALWRMVSLDRASRWMQPSRRIARFAFAAAGLTWLGLVLGLLLQVADLVGGAPLSP